MWPQILAALGMGAFSAISGEQQRKSNNRRLNEILSQLDKTKYTAEDKKIRLDEIADIYRSSNRNIENMQTGAGYLNSNVVKALALAKTQPSYLQDSANALNQMDTYNRQIDMKHIDINTQQEPPNFMGNFMPGAVAGYQLGDAIDKSINPSKYETALTDYYTELTEDIKRKQTQLTGNNTPYLQYFKPFDISSIINNLKLGSRFRE